MAYNTVQQSVGYSYHYDNNNKDNITYDDHAKPAPQPKAISRSIYRGLVELADFGPLLIQCLVDPVGTIRANAPHLIPSSSWGWDWGRDRDRDRGCSGRKTFSPKDDIPDLAGKVILVTGGQCSVLSPQSSSTIYRLPASPPKSHVPSIIRVHIHRSQVTRDSDERRFSSWPCTIHLISISLPARHRRVKQR